MCTEGLENSKLKAEHTRRLDCSGFQDLQISVRLMEGWATNLAVIGEYFEKFKTDFQQAKGRNEGNTHTQRSDNLRDGGSGTGLLEYTLFESALRDFGCLETD